MLFYPDKPTQAMNTIKLLTQFASILQSQNEPYHLHVLGMKNLMGHHSEDELLCHNMISPCNYMVH